MTLAVAMERRSVKRTRTAAIFVILEANIDSRINEGIPKSPAFVESKL
jgi:hypothetical protein